MLNAEDSSQVHIRNLEQVLRSLKVKLDSEERTLLVNTFAGNMIDISYLTSLTDPIEKQQ